MHMIIRNLTNLEKASFDHYAPHPTQSWAWGEFREKTGLNIIRLGKFDGKKLLETQTITIHPLPNLPLLSGKTILYSPRSSLPSPEMLNSIKKLGHEHNAIYVKFEPNLHIPIKTFPDLNNPQIKNFINTPNLKPAPTLFTPTTYEIDLSLTTDQLLSNMKPKWRYNIRLAEKKGVTVQEDNSPQAFERYLELTAETTNRQNFHAHTADYHRKMWQVLHPAGIAKLFTATYNHEIITTWIIFHWHDTIYYPYGASTRQHRNVMANHAMMWHTINYGKSIGATKYDLWGNAGHDPAPDDPYIGFHKFKEGFGPQMKQFIGTYDLVTNPPMYPVVQTLDKARKTYLKTIPKIKQALKLPT